MDSSDPGRHLRRGLACIAGVFLVASCSQSGSSEAVKVTAVPHGAGSSVEIVASADTCPPFDAKVKRNGSVLTVTGTGHRKSSDSKCTGQSKTVSIALPDGAYELDASGTRTPFVFNGGIVAANATELATLSKNLTLAQRASVKLGTALPSWGIMGCGQNNVYDGSNPAFDPAVVCEVEIPDTDADATDTIPHAAVARAFGCTPQESDENQELTCKTTIDGTPVVVHVARNGTDATMAVEVTR